MMQCPDESMAVFIIMTLFIGLAMLALLVISAKLLDVTERVSQLTLLMMQVAEKTTVLTGLTHGLASVVEQCHLPSDNRHRRHDDPHQPEVWFDSPRGTDSKSTDSGPPP